MSFYGKGGASSDFVGLARKLRQAEEPKTHQIYVSGCSGNVTAGKYNDGAAENRLELAKRLHEAMREAWKNTTRQPIGECTFKTTPLRLPVRTGKGFTEADLTKRLKEDPKPFGQCLAALGLSWRKRVEAGEPIDVCALDFGGPAYLLMPARVIRGVPALRPDGAAEGLRGDGRATASAGRATFRRSRPGRRTTATWPTGAGSTPAARSR